MPRVAGYSPVISPFLARILPIPRPHSPPSSPAISPFTRPPCVFVGDVVMPREAGYVTPN